MSGQQQQPAGNNQPVKKQPTFRKSDFMIRNKQADTFSQIDSFKVTAKKQAEDEQRQADQQQQFYSQGQMQPGMHPMYMQQQGFQPQMGFPGAPQGFPQQQAGFQYQAGYQQQQNYMQPQSMQQTAYMSGNIGQMPGQQPVVASQNFGMANVQQGNSNNWMNSQQQPNQMGMGMAGQVGQFNQPGLPAMQGQQLNLAQNVHGNFQQTFAMNSTTNSNATYSTSANKPQTDDFGDFSDFNSQSTSSSTAQQNNDFQAFSGFSPASNPQPSNAPSHQSMQSNTLQSSQNSSDFEAFSGFQSVSQAKTQSDMDDGFGGFGSFSEQEPASSVNGTAPQNDDDFGEFGSFDGPSQTLEQPQMPKPSAVPKLDGKRMNIVVKKNLAANSASSGITLPKPRSYGAPLPNLTLGNESRSRSNTGPGLTNLAQTLAQASSELSAPVPPPPEEQKDFTRLQGLVADKSRWSPVAKPPEPAFVLPDTPSKLNQIFPKCPPKRSSHNADGSQPDEEDDFADFSTAPATSNPASNTQEQDGFNDFAAFGSANSHPQMGSSKPTADDDGFSDFADFNSAGPAVDMNAPKNDSKFSGFVAFPPPGSSKSKNSVVNLNLAIPPPKPSQISTGTTSAVAEDEFGDFSTMSISDQPAQQSNTAAETIAPSAAAEAVKSHAADWSSFSALEALRDDEEDGNLGDFSVFGDSNLKPVSSQAQTKEQPINLLSPSQSGIFDPVAESAVPEIDTGVSAENDEWADFKSPDEPKSSQNTLSGPPPVSLTASSGPADDDGWADFGSPVAPSTQDDFQEFAQSDMTSTIPAARSDNNTPIKFDIDTNSLGSNEGVKAKPNFSALEGMFKSTTPDMSRVSSTLSFDHKNNADIMNDNDSDWSGFAVKAAVHADNISSDWSFQDNTSHGVTAEDGKSITSEGINKAVDWTAVSQSLVVDNSVKGFDWSIGGQSASVLQPTNHEADDDEWAAFGAIDRKKKPEATVSNLEAEATNDTGWGDFDESVPVHSPPPFSPSSPVSDEFTFHDSKRNGDNSGWNAFSNRPPSTEDVPSKPVKNDEFADFSLSVGANSANIDEPTSAPSNEGTDDFGAFGQLDSSNKSPSVGETDFGAFGESNPSPPPIDLKPEGNFGAFDDSSTGITWDNTTSKSDAEPTVRPNTLGDTLTQSSIDDTHQFSPPPMSDSGDHIDDEWGDFGSQGPPPLSMSPPRHMAENKWGAFNEEPPTNSNTDQLTADINRDRLRSESSDQEFSPPPLTDGDFSPLKSAGRPTSDWFSFPTEDQAEQNVKGFGETADLSADVGGTETNATGNWESPDLHVEVELIESQEPNSTDMQTTSNTAGNSVLTGPSESVSYNGPTDDNEFQFHEPPPFPDHTPADEEFPAFPDNDKFSGFDTEGAEQIQDREFPQNNDSENDFGDFGDFGSPGKSDGIEDGKETPATVEEDGWGFQDVTQEPSAVTPPSTEAEVVVKNNAMAEDQHSDCEDWGFQGTTEEFPTIFPEHAEEIPSTETKDDKIEDEDWGFKSPAATEEDEWSFGVPADTPAASNITAGTSSPPPALAGAASTLGAEADDDDDFGAFSDDGGDADFGAFSDDDGCDDGFADFGNASDNVPAATGPPVAATGQQITSDKVTSILGSIFASSTKEHPDKSTGAVKLKDSISRDGLWGTLTDLNQSKSLQLQWKECDSHTHLISSLRLSAIMGNSTEASNVGLHPVRLQRNSSSVLNPTGMMASSSSLDRVGPPSSILPPLTPNKTMQVNGKVPGSKFETKPSSPRDTTSTSSSVDMDIFSGFGASSSKTNSSSQSRSKPASADLDDLFS